MDERPQLYFTVENSRMFKISPHMAQFALYEIDSYVELFEFPITAIASYGLSQFDDALLELSQAFDVS